jgi:UDP-N-acetylmuramate--alanine ligase
LDGVTGKINSHDLTNNGSMTFGVGGKTTTTAMLAYILEKANFKPSFIDGVGNIANLGVPGRFQQGKYAVVEADDYVAVPGKDNSPKFLYLRPRIIIATNIEFDHPDVYRNLDHTLASFKAFFKLLPADGCLIANCDSVNIGKVIQDLRRESFPAKIITYGNSQSADWRIGSMRVKNQTLSSIIETKGVKASLTLHIPGKYNLFNATAALVAATQLGVSQQLALQAIADFQGTKRRFEKVGEFNSAEVWDDYAHHPVELEQTLLSARQWFPDKRIVAVFQPHTYSRTKALLDEFAGSLSLADKIIISQIYSSAREKKDDSVSGKLLVKKIQAIRKDAIFLNYKDILPHLKKHLRRGDLLLTIGAGDIYKIAYSLVKNHG